MGTAVSGVAEVEEEKAGEAGTLSVTLLKCNHSIWLFHLYISVKMFLYSTTNPCSTVCFGFNAQIIERPTS